MSGLHPRREGGGERLFLHGGPGFSAALERCWFGHALPVHWWDQPRVTAGLAQPVEFLLDAIEAELERLTVARGPIGLLASSFGARLALELLQRRSLPVSSLTIVGGTLDPRQAYVRLGERLAEVRHDPALARAAEVATATSDQAALWALIGAIASIPNLTDAYWGPAAQEQRELHRRLTDEGTLLDLPTFQAVMRQILSRPLNERSPDESVPVRVLIGRLDPMARSGDVAVWRRHFPHASILEVDAGHFPHLELPASAWL